MGQKVNPHGFRVGGIKDWDSRWFAKDNVFGDTLVEMCIRDRYPAKENRQLWIKGDMVCAIGWPITAKL